MSYLNVPSMDADMNDKGGKTLGIDLLMNPKKMGSRSVDGSVRSMKFESDADSVRSIDIDMGSPYIDIGKSDLHNSHHSMDDDDVEVVSNPPLNLGGDFGQDKFSITSSESGWKTSQQPKYSGEDILNMKREMLYQFDRLEKKGYKVPKKFTLSSSLDEMKYEFDRLKRDIETDSSIRFQRKMLMAFVSGVEFLNNKFDPFDVHLDGWSDNVSENINDYDDVFEELYEKYKGKAKIAPELRLVFTLGSSAVWFHITHAMFKTKLPNVEQVFQQNPELRKQFAQATMSTMAQSAGNPSASAGFGGLSGLFGMFGGGGPSSMGGQQIPMPPPQRPPMRGPSNVDDLLNELKEERFRNNNETLELFSNLSESDLTVGDTIEEVSVTGGGKKKRKPKRRTLDI